MCCETGDASAAYNWLHGVTAPWQDCSSRFSLVIHIELIPGGECRWKSNLSLFKEPSATSGGTGNEKDWTRQTTRYCTHQNNCNQYTFLFSVT